MIWHGPTRALAGEPRLLGGHGRDRYVYAPATGTFRTPHQIGDDVAAGNAVASNDDLPVMAPLSGCLRGLCRDGVPVATGTKVIEVDPRGGAAIVTGIGERPRQIADGVLAPSRRGRTLALDEGCWRQWASPCGTPVQRRPAPQPRITARSSAG